MSSPSLWTMVSKEPVNFPPLTERVEVDVIIVGAGITGLTAALELTNAGKKVAVVDAYTVGSGTTGFSTGNLYIPVQPYFYKVISKFDVETAKVVADARRAAIDYVEAQSNGLNIDCNFSRRPWFVYTNEESCFKKWQREVDAMKSMELDIRETNSMPLKLDYKKAAMLENQARFNPLAYTYGLAQHLKSKGCAIYENTRVLSIDEKKTVTAVQTENLNLSAQHVIIATHTPIGINSTQLFIAPYRSYVIALRLEDEHYPEGNFWDLESPHHAISTHPYHGKKPELLMIAGSHHKTGQTKDEIAHYEELLNFATYKFKVKEVVAQWSAQHYKTADDLPYIGLIHNKSARTYIATGYFADGLTYGTVAGLILKKMIMDEKSDWIKTFNSTRLDFIKSAGFLAKEGTNVFVQYVKDYTRRLDKNFDDLPKCEGKIAEINKEKCAVYRDEHGQLHAVSAICTHMKCVVSWNNAEKTWDCPCHGSRFEVTGEVIEGPATMPLEKKAIVEADEKKPVIESED